jgi:carbon monoxide dehydrogenase subunit G
MASITKETIVDAPPEAVWDALRDWGAVHERLVPGFVTATELDGEDRIVTFFNGMVARELFVSCDDGARRLVWSVRSEGLEHHNGSAQVFAHEDGRTRFVWIADVLPHAAAPRIADMMEISLASLRETLGGDRAESARPVA